MAKTEVILTRPVEGLGGESDQVKVAAGYARNYLIPYGYGIPVNSANKRRLEALKKRRIERESHELNSASELGKSLSKMVLPLTVKTGDDGKMFGSVTPAIIAEELKHQFEVDLDKRKIHIEDSIRAIGDYLVKLHLHHDVHVDLKIKVVSTNPEVNKVETPEPKRAPTSN